MNIAGSKAGLSRFTPLIGAGEGVAEELQPENALANVAGGPAAKGAVKLGGIVWDGAKFIFKHADEAKDTKRMYDVVDRVEGGRAVKAAEDGGQAAGKAPEGGPNAGTYTIEFESGSKYHGKGGTDRMEGSAERVGGERNDLPVEKRHTPAVSEREAFKEESRRIETDGGPGQGNYNRIDSPGTKYRREDGEKSP